MSDDGTGALRRAAAPRYEVVVVSYRSRDLVAELMARFPAAVPFVVVDNYSGQDGVPDLVASRPNARYLDGEGVGFAKAANLGARTSGCEYVVFANPDSEPDHTVFDELVDELEADPVVVTASALLVDHNGKPEIGAAGYEPGLARALVHSVGLHKVFPERGLWARPEPHRPARVDWTTGAALAVRREAFLRLGGFDESFYVYNEDVALGAAVRESGGRQVLRTDLLVTHASGGSGAPSRQMMRLRGASMAHYLSRRRSRPVAVLTRAVLAAGYLVRALVSLLARDRGRVGQHLSWVAGVTTGTAVVGGREVSRSAARSSVHAPPGKGST